MTTAVQVTKSRGRRAKLRRLLSHWRAVARQSTDEDDEVSPRADHGLTCAAFSPKLSAAR